MNKHLKAVLKMGFLVIVIIYLAVFFVDNFDKLKTFDWQFDIIYLLSSFLFLLLLLMSIAFAWSYLLNCLGYRISYIRLMSIWFKSQPGKYLPGRVMMFVTRTLYTMKHKVRGTDIFLSHVLEVIIICVATLLIGLPVINKVLPQYSIFAILFMAAVVLGFLVFTFVPGILIKSLQLLKIKKNIIPDNKQFSILKKINVLIIYLVGWFLGGLGFFLLVNSITPMGAEQFMFLTSAFALSWLVGLLAIFAPAGIGVREGVLSLLLTEIMPLEQAVVIAVVARIWWTLGEIVLLGLFALLEKLNK